MLRAASLGTVLEFDDRIQFMRANVTICVDAHAHLHPCFEVEAFLQAARANLQQGGTESGSKEQIVCVVVVLATPTGDGFRRLVSASENGRLRTLRGEEWQFRETKEQTAVWLFSRTGPPLVAVEGDQVESREGVEVLALGTGRRFEDGQRIEELLRAIAQEGALPVIPWGVGKWLGRRGEVVQRMIEAPGLPLFFVGDNANRPTFWPKPRHFQRAREHGIRNLPGSDPLPFPEDVRRVGRFGGVVTGDVNRETPAEDLKQILLDPTSQFSPFGQEERLFPFVRRQLKMQVRKLL